MLRGCCITKEPRLQEKFDGDKRFTTALSLGGVLAIVGKHSIPPSSKSSRSHTFQSVNSLTEKAWRKEETIETPEALCQPKPIQPHSDAAHAGRSSA